MFGDNNMIKYLFLDIDGTLTDGKIYIGNDGECMKAFSIKDGYAFNYILKPVGIIPIVITGRESRIVSNRCNELGISNIYQGVLNKYSKIVELVGEDNLAYCAYFGDDLIDYESMKNIKEKGGIIGCPADAVSDILNIADYVCKQKAGDGAFREFAEILLDRVHQNILNERINTAMTYIKNIDKNYLKPGIYNVNDWLHYYVKEYDTKERIDCILESHKKYIDIHYIVSGEEIIEIGSCDELEIEKAYFAEEDITIYHKNDKMNKILMVANTYILVHPNNAYMGGIQTNDKCHITKIIVKVDCTNF